MLKIQPYRSIQTDGGVTASSQRDKEGTICLKDKFHTLQQSPLLSRIVCILNSGRKGKHDRQSWFLFAYEHHQLHWT